MAAPIQDPYSEKPYQLVKPEQIATAPKSFPLRRVLESHADVLAPLCPPGVNIETVTAQLYAAVLRTPQIAEATPQSLIIALSNGIPTGGVCGSDWYLLPFRNKGVMEVSFAFDYKFLAACIVQAGGARSIDAEVVRKSDTFKIVKGSNPHIIHEPPPFGDNRGPIVGFYAVAHIGANVPAKHFAMSLEDVEKIRAKSKQWNPEKIGKDCPEWYGCARVVHRLGKLLPKKRNARMEALERIMDADARVDEAEPGEIVVTGPLEVVTDDNTGSVSTHVNTTFDAQMTPELERALSYSVKQKDGTSRTLADLANDELTKLEQWAHDKGNTRVADMCGLVLHYRTVRAATQELQLEEVPE